MAANFEFRLQADHEPVAKLDTETMEKHSAGIRVSDSNEIYDDWDGPSISTLWRCKEIMKNKKLEYEAELISQRIQQAEELEPNSSVVNDQKMTDLCERVRELKTELFNISSERSYKKLLLKRLLLGDLLIKKLFPDTVSDMPSHEQIIEMHSFAARCEYQNKLCTEILENLKGLSRDQKALESIRRQNFELKKSNREAMARLQRLKKEKEEGFTSTTDKVAIRRAKETLSEGKAKIEVVKNVFQGLIVASGINWAVDDKLRRLVLSVGEPVLDPN